MNTNKANRLIEEAFNANNLALDATGQNKDSNATTWQAIFGYRLNPYLAAEITYLDLSGPSYRLSGDATFPPTFIAPVPVTTKADWSASGFPISVLGIWPITDAWEVFGRVGVFIGDVDVKVSLNADNSDAGGRAEGVAEQHAVHRRRRRELELHGHVDGAGRVGRHAEHRQQPDGLDQLEPDRVLGALQVLTVRRMCA